MIVTQVANVQVVPCFYVISVWLFAAQRISVTSTFTALWKIVCRDRYHYRWNL